MANTDKGTEQVTDTTMTAKTKTTQDGKTTVIKVMVANGSHLGKVQVSGANEQDARNNLEALLQVVKAGTEVTYV